MKFLIFLLLLTPGFLKAKNIYISATGNNTTGVSPSDAWKDIARLNAMALTVASGDRILFHCGETFTGSIEIKKGGVLGADITYGSYGTGAKPIISGFVELTGWTNSGGNIWWATPSKPVKKTNSILTIGGKAYAYGRTPNEGQYYIYQSANNTQLSSLTLTGTPSYVGAQVVVRKNIWFAMRGKVLAQAGNVITFDRDLYRIDNKEPVYEQAGTAGFGYFFQKIRNSLDVFGEWYHDTVANRIELYSVTDPSAFSIKTTYVDTLVKCEGFGFLTFDGLAFEGANVYGIESYYGNNVTIANCAFNNNTKPVYIWNTTDAAVVNSTFDNSFQSAITCENRQRKRIIISNNIVRNTGLLMGMGIYQANSNLKAIVSTVEDAADQNYNIITKNLVVNSGHAGIVWNGSNTLVKFNMVDSFGVNMGDIGGVYNFISNSAPSSLVFSGIHLDSNFISHGLNAPTGAAGSKDVAGLYNDAQVNDFSAVGNVIDSIEGPGYQISTAHNTSFKYNIVYGCESGGFLIKAWYGETYGNSIKYNTIYQNNASHLIWQHNNSDTTLPTPTSTINSIRNIADIDSNKLTNLNALGYNDFYTQGANKFYSLATWKSVYLHDQNSTLPPIAVTPSNTILIKNWSDTEKIYRFEGLKKMTSDGVNYENIALIPPMSAKLFINNGTASTPNVPPIANAGSNAQITLPTNSYTLLGSASTFNGATITGWLWEEVVGNPITGTIVNSAAQSTLVQNLLEGTYTYKLTATDNNSNTGDALVVVVVKPAPVVPPATGPAMLILVKPIPN